MSVQVPGLEILSNSRQSLNSNRYTDLALVQRICSLALFALQFTQSISIFCSFCPLPSTPALLCIWFQSLRTCCWTFHPQWSSVFAQDLCQCLHFWLQRATLFARKLGQSFRCGGCYTTSKYLSRSSAGRWNTAENRNLHSFISLPRAIATFSHALNSASKMSPTMNDVWREEEIARNFLI